jgi:hypothetical protein
LRLFLVAEKKWNSCTAAFCSRAPSADNLLSTLARKRPP